MTPVDSILARLLALHPKRIDLSLDRMLRVLERLGHPERRVPPVIHVAGTNGKGSTIAFLRAMLEAAGKSVHVYTSPNLVRVNERFRLGRAAACWCPMKNSPMRLPNASAPNGDAPITVFEIETAAAFVLFARHPADMLLLEVGLGGRLDATNVIERPLATVVTPVSMDHIEFLGDTLEKIAAEKAGIFRKGVPAVIAPQASAASGVLERQAEKVRAPLHAAGPALDRACRARPPRLSGRAGPVRPAAAKAVRPPSVRQCRHRDRGAARGRHPAAGEGGRAGADARRMAGALQRLTTGKLLALAPAGAELWLDGGHNADGGRAIAAALGDLEERVSRPLVLVVGMLATKDREGFLRNFTGLVRRVFGVPIHQDKGVPAAEIAAAAQAAGMPADAAPGIAEALAAIGRLGFEPPPRILITGSLYLAGEVLAANGTEPV